MVSSVWLQEIYKTVLEVDMLGLSGYDLNKSSTLLKLLQKFSQVGVSCPTRIGEYGLNFIMIWFLLLDKLLTLVVS